MVLGSAWEVVLRVLRNMPGDYRGRKRLRLVKASRILAKATEQTIPVLRNIDSTGLHLFHS